VTATVKVGALPQGIAVDSKRNRAYVANTHGDSVTVIDGGRGIVLGTIAAGKNPYALAVDEKSGRLFVVSSGDAAMVVVDPRW
jgi:YVTN family beta-propeller protein